MMSYYRDAELHGAALLLRLMKIMADDPEAQVKLTLQVAQETHHAWLWTKRMIDMGARPVKIVAGYQTRIGRRLVPHSVAELLTLTIVVEERSLARYAEHAARPGVDDATRRVLQSVSADEEWHLAWLRDALDRITARDAVAREHVNALTGRYRRVEEEVYGELVAHEMEAFGDDVARV